MASRRTYQRFTALAAQSLAASADVEIPVDFKGMQDVTYCLECDYGTVGSPAGVTVVAYPGFYDPDGNLVYADNAFTITGSIDPTGNGQTKRFGFALDLSVFGQFAKIAVTNQDTANAISAVSLYGAS